jgi:glutamate synthase domain-containing protein 3
MTLELNAKGVYYKELNEEIRSHLDKGVKEILVGMSTASVISGDGVTGDQRLILEGTPGNDMAAFMNGLEIIVKGNSQDGTGNTMNDGRVIIHGHTGDTTGYAMRGRGNICQGLCRLPRRYSHERVYG